MAESMTTSKPSRQLLIVTVGLAMMIGGAAAFMVFANSENGNNSKAHNSGEKNAGENDVDDLLEETEEQLDLSDELSEAEQQRILRRAQREIRRWEEFRAPRDADERFEYMRSMEESIQFFVEIQRHNLLFRMLETMLPAHREDAAFLVLYGFLIAQTPDPSVQRRALQHIDRAIRIDPRFDYALYVSGAVRVILQKHARQSSDRQLRTAVEHLGRAARLRKEFADTYRALAMAHHMRDDPDSARHAIEKAIELDPNDEENWQAYFSLIGGGGRIADPERLEELLEKYAEQIDDKVLFIVYGMLGDDWLGHNQFTRAYHYYVEKALPIAYTIPDELSPEQWRLLYGQAGLLSASKSPPSYTTAYAFLDRALEYARDKGLDVYPLVEQYAHVMGVVLERSPSGIDEIEKMRELVELVFESLRNDSITDDQRGNLVQVLVELFRQDEVDVAELEFDRTRLWQIAVWLLETYESNQNRAIFNIALQCLHALMPDAMEEPVDPEQLEDVSSSDLGVVLRVLISHGLAATRLHISRWSQLFTARLLQATAGQGEEMFVDRAREFLEGPTSPEATRRKARVAGVLQIYPIKELADPLITALQRTIDTENLDQVRRFFTEAHPALNAIAEEPLHLGEDLGIDRSIERLTLDQYQRLLDEWRIRFPR